MKRELLFEVEQDEDILIATCHDPQMATQGANLDELILMIRDLIQCRFEEGNKRLNWRIRLHSLQDPILSAKAA